MARPLSTLAHGLIWPFILLSLAGFIIALSGLASSQRACNGDPAIAENPEFSQVGTNPQIACSKAFRWPWFVLFFSSLPVVLTAIAAASNCAHPAWAAPLLGWTVAAATLSMIIANLSLNNVDAFWQMGGPILHRFRTMFAGFLILSAGLLGLLFGHGAAMQGRGEGEEEEGVVVGGKRGSGGGYSQQQQHSQPTVTYGAPTGAAGGATRTTQGPPGPAV